MGMYWGEVAKRAARQAAKDAKLDTAAGVVVLFVSQAAIGIGLFVLLGQLTDANLWTRVMTGLAPFIIYPLAFVARMLTVPAAMARESHAKLQSLTPTPAEGPKGGFELTYDTPLHQAIRWAASGTWDKDEDVGPNYLNDMATALRDFHQIAANDHIRTWYRPYPDGVFDILGGSAWRSHNVVVSDILNGDDIMRRRRDGSVIETCHDIRVCRAQMEANWHYWRSRLPA